MSETRIEPENVQLDLDDYEVVRIEFLSAMHEPSFTFSDGKIGVNTACVRRVPEAEYVQILVNAEAKKMAVRIAREEDIHSFQWAKTKEGKRFPRQVTGRILFMKIFDLMGWNPDHRYKIVGKFQKANEELLFVFNLNDGQVFERTVGEDGKHKASRRPVFPAEWKNQFGIPFSEHKKALQINLFDGYTVFSVKDMKKTDEAQQGGEADE